MFGRFKRRKAPEEQPSVVWPDGVFDDDDLVDRDGNHKGWSFDRVTLRGFQYIAGHDDLLAIVMADLDVWESYASKAMGSLYKRFKHMYQHRQEFRSLVFFRVRSVIGSVDDFFKILAPAPDWLHVTNLFLSTPDIGPGLYIEHGFSTIVYAQRIGRNFWLNQNVTIGNSKGGLPTFGDDCQVRTGAIVVGGITIGNRVRIGANAFVDFDVPDDSLVVPQRSRIIPAKPRPPEE